MPSVSSNDPWTKADAVHSESARDLTDRQGRKSQPAPASLPQFCGHERFRDAALFWHEFGFTVIPVVPGTKVPAVKWDAWCNGLSSNTISMYWREHPDHEVGFIVGDSYIVFDADSEKATAVLRDTEVRMGVRPLLISRTTRGEHHFFQRDPSRKVKTTCMIVGDPQDRIDVKTGRTMVVLPPSTGKELVLLGDANA
jgi:hypothetical protein